MFKKAFICSTCLGCIFFHSFGSRYFCRASFPSLPLRMANSSDFDSYSSYLDSFFSPCSRFIDFIDHLSDLRSIFDGGEK